MLIIRPYESRDGIFVLRLWSECGLFEEHPDPHKARFEILQGEHTFFLVAELYREVIATIIGGYNKGHGWIDYLAVKPEFQRHRCGEQMIQQIEQLLSEAGCRTVSIIQAGIHKHEIIRFCESLGYKNDSGRGFEKLLRDP